MSFKIFAAARGALFLLFCAAVMAPMATAAEERDAVLAVNDAFYSAFRESDMTRMADLWAKNLPVAVQHPATRLIEGRAKVLESWAQILAFPPAIRCELESVSKAADRWAVVCVEHLNPGTVRMINIFQQENNEWKMIYHGPAPPPATTS